MSDERTLDFDSPVLRRGFTAVPNALLENTSLSIGARMTLIALMSFAWKGDPFPGQERLASMLGVSDRTVREYLTELRVKEFVKVTRRGSGRTNLYRISSRRVLGAEESAATGPTDRKQSSGLDRKQASDKEDEEKKTKRNLAAAPRNGHPPRRSKADLNAIWDTLTDIFGAPTTRTAETLRGRVVQSLAAAGATSDEIVRRAKTWPHHFDSATLTAAALEKHWDTLGLPPLRSKR